MRRRRGLPTRRRAGRAAAALLATALALTAAGPAGAETLHLDAGACRVRFTLDATLHEVEGFFSLHSGSIRFDPATGEASGRVVIAATSGETHNDRRDRKMHDKVLESRIFPEIVFVPARIEGAYRSTGDSDVRLGGAIEIHGTRHQVVIPARIHLDDGRLTGSAGLAIPYVAWGMEDPSFLMFRVAKEVLVSLELVGTVDDMPDGSGP